jgi:arylsulfatase A-like enzyme
MERRDFLKWGGAWSLAALLSGRQSLLAESKKQKMNILWIVADDLGCGDLGCYGTTDIPTPHLDRLAAEGILFERAYGSPVCSPTRASLLTGRYPQDFRMEEALTGDDHGTFHPDPVTAAECFKANGYRTALVGKWHLGKEASAHPLNQGFEYFYGFLGGVIHYLRVRSSRTDLKPECWHF